MNSETFEDVLIADFNAWCINMPQATTLVRKWDEVVLSAARDNARI